MTMPSQRIEIPELTEREVYHQIILSTRSQKSTSPDGSRRLDCFQSDQGLPPPGRKSWMTEQNAHSRAHADIRIANGGRMRSMFRCCIATPACPIPWTRRTIT